MSRDLVITPRDLVRDCRCSLALDGVDDYVDVGNSDDLNLTGPFTVEGWIFLRALPAVYAFIFARDKAGARSYALGINKLGQCYAENNAGFAGVIGGVAAKTKIPVGRWTYFSMGHNGTSLLARVHGVASASSVAAVCPSVADSTNIGRRAYVGSNLPIAAALCGLRVFKGRYTTDAEFAERARGEPSDQSNLVRWWKLEDELAGYAFEEIGKTFDTVVGALPSPIVPFRRRRVVEDVGAAASCPGAVGITVANHADLNPGAGSFGIMGWLNLASYVANGRILIKRPLAGYQLYTVDATSLRAYIHDGTTAAFVSAYNRIAHPSGWVHVAMCRDVAAGLLLLYLDAGSPVSASAAALGSLDNTDPLSFGTDPATAADANVNLNDWLWRKGAAFTWDEIRNHFFDGQVPACPSGCKQIGWAMDENGGTTVHSSPAGYDGTLSSDSWTTSTRCRPRDVANPRDAA